MKPITGNNTIISTAGFMAISLMGLCSSKAEAQSQPPNTLSITSYGASTSSSDNRTAIQNCFNAAQSQGVGVWIPSGTYTVRGTLNATDITITGAGMTSSTIYRQKPNATTDTVIYLTRCTVRDLGVDGNGTGRNNGTADGGLNLQGVGWLMERVRISHSDAGMWASGSNGTVRNCQFYITYADGCNINNGDGPNKLGHNLTVENCVIDNHLDDGIAINSQGISLGRQNMQNPKVINSETRNCQGANGLRIAGGVNPLVQGNYVHDMASGGENGIQVGRFSGDGFYCDNGKVINNTFTRVSGHNDTAGIWVYEDAECDFQGNHVVDSYQHGVRIGSSDINFGANNTIRHPAKRGIWITSTSGGANGGTTTGSADILYNTVQNLNAGQPAFQNDAGGSMSVTQTQNSWQSGAGASGVTFYQSTNYAGGAGLPLDSGSYTQAQLVARGVSNDWASSVRVPSGWTVVIYSGDNFTGTSWTRTADTPNLGSLSPSANDQMSSCVISSTGATFYQNTNYGGAAGQVLPVGTYTLAQLVARGVPNDWASSVRIPAGRTVTMYSDDNFMGTSWTLSADTPNFPGLSPNANDVMSSCRVE